jgi:hypothetical protein
MSRTRTKTLLHYVLHKFNYNNLLCLVNRNFHINSVDTEHKIVRRKSKTIKIEYCYIIDWILSIKIREYDQFMYENKKHGIVSYQIMDPWVELHFSMNNSENITIYYRGMFIAQPTQGIFIKVWHELEQADVSGKIQILMRYQPELMDWIRKNLI